MFTRLNGCRGQSSCQGVQHREISFMLGTTPQAVTSDSHLAPRFAQSPSTIIRGHSDGAYPGV